uniref:Uncharacterized protein n=1 Tax=Ditylenchus dipsaci TaxID=166011 RepID=A0A915EJ41_9BILA
MLATTALSLFFLFWSTLFLVDFYLRSIHFAKYLDFVERHGLSISPFQIRFYINRVDHSSSSLSSSGLTSSLQAWTSRSKRTLRFTATWFSIGALVGLVCFVVTPIYLSWLLLIELSNGFTWLKWHQLTPTAPSMPWLFPGATATPKTNGDDDAFNAALASLNQQQPDANSLFYVPYQEHVQSGITPIIPGLLVSFTSLAMPLQL